MTKRQNYLWLDLETTGSDENVHHIIEIGAIITNDKLEFIDDWWTIVNPPSWAGMDDVVVRMHIKSGLLATFEDYGNDSWDIAQADGMIVEWLKGNGALQGGKIILAGSGVGHFDRRFIRKYMPLLEKRLTFAPFDVGQVRRFLTLAGVVGRPKDDPKTHRALKDAEEHLAEARKFIEWFRELGSRGDS